MEIFKLVFSPIEVNTYILVDKSGDCAIIDCGCYNGNEFKQLDQFIEEKGINPVLNINTHCHLDHVFGNRYLLERFALAPYSHELEEPNRKNSAQHALLFGLTMDDPPAPAGFITDGQTIKFGTTELIALHVPGHAPGSIAFYSEKNACVFTGDALFAGSIGRSDLPGGDHKTLIESINNKLFTLPQETAVYPGHGTDTSIGQEINSNPFFK